MKKRFLSLSLALCMVLTACGSGGEEKQTTDPHQPLQRPHQNPHPPEWKRDLCRHQTLRKSRPRILW